MMIIKDETTWMETVLKSFWIFTSTYIFLASVDWASICCSESSGNYGTDGDWQW